MSDQELAPHQQRVVAERDELRERLTKLNEFIEGDVFKTLDTAEGWRLQRQQGYMSAYLGVLCERIENF